MRHVPIVTVVLVAGSAASGSEVIFHTGPQEYEGRRYYWLAEWDLEVTLPSDVAPGDRFEVLFGSKGPQKRTLYFQYAGRTGSLKDVRPTPYEWIALPLGTLLPGGKALLFGKGRLQVAFLAGVRIKGRSKRAPQVRAIPKGPISHSREGRAVWSDIRGFTADSTAGRLWDPAPSEPDWDRAARSARYAGIALTKVQRWLRERCLQVRDRASGLFRARGSEWNYWDTAADCYPFYLWAAYFTDRTLLNTVMLETLQAEQRLCNHLDRLPVSYDMDARRKKVLPLDRIIFGASEYAKDSLVPIVELLGKESPWFERMRGIVDDIFKHAPIDTPYGPIPSTSIEVNGELLQVLPRLYCVTGQRKYLAWAHRLADYYLKPGKFVPHRLSDHGCEIIGGLGLLFAVAVSACPEKAREYEPHLRYMFGEILKRGTNSDGIIVGELQQAPGPHDTVPTRDGWGYDLVGFLDYDMALGTRTYYDAVRTPLSNLLKPRYRHYNWGHPSRDNIADSVEGALYLLRYLPVTEGFVWTDREIATVLVDHADPNRLWGTHKLEANTVRTVLIHTMLHTRNTIARPYRPGLQFGAAPSGDGLCLYLQSKGPYKGRLQFDVPRHRLCMGFRKDWPRMNTVPEYFTVEPDETRLYSVRDFEKGEIQIITGKTLTEGLPIQLTPERPLRLEVLPLKDTRPSRPVPR